MIFFSKNAAINVNPGFPLTNDGGARDGYRKTPFSKMRRGFFSTTGLTANRPLVGEKKWR
jgi:hypothetical protein